jgi:hypothetical protein
MDWRVLILAAVVLVLAAGLWAFRARAADGSAGFGRVRRNGYVAEDVDQLLDRVYSLPSTADGRAEALRLVNSARFHLDRTGGYQPVAVDRFVDSVTAALSAGVALPPRPER